MRGFDGPRNSADVGIETVVGEVCGSSFFMFVGFNTLVLYHIFVFQGNTTSKYVTSGRPCTLRTVRAQCRPAKLHF